MPCRRKEKPGTQRHCGRARNILNMDSIAECAEKRNDNRDDSQQTRWPRDIIIGDRYRKELGDIGALARSINEHGGLIHPISITPAVQLIAGERRWHAWQHAECRFRDQPIPVTVLDVDNIVAAERDENDPALRKAFTPSEAVAIARVLRPRLEAEAKKRQRQHGGTAPGRPASEGEHLAQVAQSVSDGGGELSPAPAPVAKPNKGRVVDKIAKATGKGARTLEKAEAIVAAAEAEPEKFGKLVEAMDRTGRVNGPYKRLTNLQAVEKIKAEPSPLPGNGPYHTGLMDLPWASESDDDKDHGERGYYPYPTMTARQAVKALPVPSILHPNSSVWLWITNFHLMRGEHLVFADAWGMKPVALLTWIKRTFGQGQRVRGATEHLIQLVRGDVPCLGYDTKTWFEGEGGAHSQKPETAYEIIEKLTPAARYFELFARGQPRDNWDLHGNEIGKLVAPSRPAPAKSLSPAPPVPKMPAVAAPDDAGLDIPEFLRRGHPACVVVSRDAPLRSGA